MKGPHIQGPRHVAHSGCPAYRGLSLAPQCPIRNTAAGVSRSPQPEKKPESAQQHLCICLYFCNIHSSKADWPIDPLVIDLTNSSLPEQTASPFILSSLLLILIRHLDPASIDSSAGETSPTRCFMRNQHHQSSTRLSRTPRRSVVARHR